MRQNVLFDFVLQDSKVLPQNKLYSKIKLISGGKKLRYFWCPVGGNPENERISNFLAKMLFGTKLQSIYISTITVLNPRFFF